MNINGPYTDKRTGREYLHLYDPATQKVKRVGLPRFLMEGLCKHCRKEFNAAVRQIFCTTKCKIAYHSKHWKDRERRAMERKRQTGV